MRLIQFSRPCLKATFLGRPNRFLGVVELDSQEREVHIHDPGRLNELLYSGNQVLVSPAETLEKRRTQFDLIFARRGEDLVLVNSALHSEIAQKILEYEPISPLGHVTQVRREVPYGKGTRFDFEVNNGDGKTTLVEVKGCTLCDDKGIALFPDAPTKRGQRHLEHLIDVVKKGKHRALLMILVLCPWARCFSPNAFTDPRFASLFREALESGVDVCCKKVVFKNGWFVYSGDIEIHGGSL